MSEEREHIDDIRVAKYLSGEMSESEMETFFSDLDTNLSLVDKLDIASAIYSKTDRQTFDIEQVLGQVLEAKVEKRSTTKGSPKDWRRSKRKQRAIAASIALFVTATLFWKMISNNQANFLVLETQNNTLIDTLPDGSIVSLNKFSRIAYDLNSEKTRKVKMQGEVFFEITKDPTKPFRVKGENVNIEVLGTSFLVLDRIYNGKVYSSDSVHVIVESGTVKVSNNYAKKPIILLEGEKVSFNTNKPNLEKSVTEQVDHLYWKNQMIVFRKLKLHKVIKKLNQLYSSNITLKNNEIKNCKITVSFKGNSLDEVLEVIGLTFNLDVQKSAGNRGYILSGNGCLQK